MDSVGLGLPPMQIENSQINGLGQEEYLRILSTQLKFQDPMKPLDNQQFMSQMAQFSMLDQSRITNDRLTVLLNQLAANQSVGLIGKTVEVAMDYGQIIGQVTTISFTEGQPMLTVKTDSGDLLTQISLNQVMLIRGS